MDADVPLLAVDGCHHQLQQDGAVAAHARTAARMANDAAHSQHLLRALEVQAPEAVGLLRRRARGHRSGHVWFFDEVYRSSNTFDYGVQEFRSERLDDKTFTHDRRRPAATARRRSLWTW